MAPVNAHLCAQSLNVFGWQLRDGQKQVISAVVAGRVALAEIPDRIGEVAVHQVAGSAAGGLVVVVAPSVALQDDHVAEQRQHSNVPTVASINASPPPPPAVRFMFLDTEQLAKDNVVPKLLAAGASSVAVDEAHCVSSRETTSVWSTVPSRGRCNG